MATDFTDTDIANDKEFNRHDITVAAWWDESSKQVRSLKVNNKWQLSSEDSDPAWRQGLNTIFWDSIVAWKIDEIEVKFDLWIPLELTTTTTANGGTVTESTSRAILQTSTTTNGSAKIESADRVRYSPWHDIYAYFTYAWLDWWVVGSTNYAWIFDDENGYMIWYDWTQFKAIRRKGWSDTSYNQWSWLLDNLDWNWASWFTLDHTKINIFRITFWYLGIASAVFEIYTWPAKWWVAFHYTGTENSLTELAIENPNLPIRCEIIKTSWATNVRGLSWSWNAWYYNADSENTVWSLSKNYDTWITWQALTWTWNENVVIFHLKDTFNWKASHVKIKKVFWEFKNTATADTIVARVIKNPTTVWWIAVASLSYTDIDTNNSVMEYSAWGWVVVWWEVKFSTYMQWWGSWWNAFAWASDIDADKLGLTFRPDDYFAIVYTRVSWSWAYNALFSDTWIELF